MRDELPAAHHRAAIADRRKAAHPQQPSNLANNSAFLLEVRIIIRNAVTGAVTT